jgi:hypothetical protein
MLKLTSITAPSALLAALTLASAPAVAQERYHGRQNPAGEQSSGQSRERAQPRNEAPRDGGARAPRQETQRAQPPQQQQPQQQQAQQPPQRQAQPQAQPQRQAEQPRVDNRAYGNRSNDNRGNDNRSNDNRGNRSYDNRASGNGRNDDRRGEAGRAVPRGNVYAPRYSPRYSPRTYAPRAYSPRGYGYYGSRSYYRPYTFRPRFSIGFGIFAGYPVPYTYSYPYPIVVYGYRAPRERVIVTPGSPYYGGVALEMTPYDADVFVDGEYAGHVEDFDGTTQPLTLSAGMHEIEVQAQGYEPMRINVEIQPGQVIPYRGDLRPY